MSWEELQEKLFEQLFKTEEKYITLIDLLHQIEPISKIWSFLEKILIEDGFDTFDFFESIDEIKLLDGYIFIKVNLWEYIVIDPAHRKCLTDEECKILFNEEYFLTNFNEEKTDNTFVDMYYFRNISKNETIDSLIDYVNEYQEVLTKENKIYHSIDYLNSRVDVSIRMDKCETTIRFIKFDGKEGEPSNGNYLFFNKDAKLTGASNPTSNHESLLTMGKKAYGIKIPCSVIPSFINNENIKRLTYKS